MNEWMPTWEPFFSPADKSTWESFLDWGYYSMPFVDNEGKPLGNGKTKIVQLNNNICYTLNWESFTNFEDPGNMLGWLHDELKEIEANNGTAIILSHVPNIDECNREYGRRYHAIMDRFQTVIRWGMYAHIHEE